MRAIDRKLLRDVWHIREQALAIAAVIACGVATFVMSLTTWNSLKLSQEAYYERYRFAHVFAHLKRAPQTVLKELEQIPGIGRIQARVVFDVMLDVPGLTEPAVGRLISLPQRGEPDLNRVHLRRGRLVNPQRSDEVLASEGFCKAHKFEPGDAVSAIINGRRKRLKIVGVALSPEYIYQIRPGDMFPDEKRFGIFWMDRKPLEAAFDMKRAFNDAAMTLMPGAVEAEVLRRTDKLLEKYGGLGSFGRYDQVSNRFISDEIKQLRAMAVIAPSIFLVVAAFLLNVVLTRIIQTQREQIAALKAFGYANWDVGLHYMKMALLISLLGVAIGAVAGLKLADGLTAMYGSFYHFPVLTVIFDPVVVLGAVGISSGAAMLGTLTAVRRAVALPPAEAMRPEPPANFRPTIIERMGMTALLSQAARMVLRNLERKPHQAAMSVVGLSLAVSVLILGNFGMDSLDYIMDVQFGYAQREDASVALFEPKPARAIHDFKNLPGVIRAEPFRVVSTRLRHGHRARRVGVLGIQPDAKLHRLIDAQERVVPVPPQGLALSSKMAELLDVKAGELVTVEMLEGKRLVRDVPVTALVNEYLGAGAYMDLGALQELTNDGETISGAYVFADGKLTPAMYDQLKHSPRVAGTVIRQAAMRNFKETIGDNMLRMRFFNVMFSTIIAFGVVYNSARIALAERGRELASLRVLGFTRGEISAILLGELAVLILIALPLGLWLGYFFVSITVKAFDTDLYRLPLVIVPATYGRAALVVLTAAVFSGLVVRRKLDHLDLVAVLKTRE